MKFFHKYNTFLIITAWIITTGLYLYFFGITGKLEAEKYITEARRLLDYGSFSSVRFLFYSITILTIAFSFYIKTGLTGAFVIQAGVNLFAFLLFNKALKKKYNHQSTSLLAIFFLLIFWPYQSWVVFLYTESLFYSAILILTSVIILYKPNSLRHIVYVIISLLFVIFSRPLGILFSIGTMAFIFYHAPQKIRKILLLSSLAFIAIVFIVINTIFSNINDWYITKPFIEESIICDMPGNLPSGIKLDLIKADNPLLELSYYVSHNFKHFCHFAILKLKYFILMTRPYYSNAHNIMLLVCGMFVYTLMLLSFLLRHKNSSFGISLFINITVLIYILAIVFQCDDYHNRFILSIYPLFVMTAGESIDYFSTKFLKKRKTDLI